MKRFRCTVTRTDEFIIEIDENIHNEEWMEEYRKYFTNLHSLKEHAENVAWNRSNFGDSHYEGYGYPLIDDKKMWNIKDGEQTKSININVINEGDDYEIECEEI